MTPEEITQTLNHLEEFDFENFSDDRYRRYKKIFGSVFDGVQELPLGPVQLLGQHFTRVRRNMNRERFGIVKDIWHPPKDKTPFGRLNFRYDPMFYAFQNEAIALIEMRPQKDEVMTCLTFKLKQSYINCIPIGAKALEKVEIQFNSEAGKLLYEFIARHCRKYVPSDKPEFYCPTMLFSKSLRNNNFDAFVYESVPAKFNGLNFAFKPAFIEAGFEFVQSRTVRILDVSENSDYIVQCLAESDELDGDKFIWQDITDCEGHLIEIEDIGINSYRQ